MSTTALPFRKRVPRDSKYCRVIVYIAMTIQQWDINTKIMHYNNTWVAANGRTCRQLTTIKEQNLAINSL